MRPIDLRLYAILDPSLLAGRDPIALARAAIAGGATMIQLRDKNDDARATVALGKALRAAITDLGAPLIVNDRIDVALAIDADGAHVGQDDLPPEDARRLLGEERLLGLSIGGIDEADGCRFVDHAGLGCVFPSQSKPPAEPPLGAHGLRKLARDLRAGPLGSKPVCAIGGIDAGNARDAILAGADGIAVIGALFGAGERGEEAVSAAASALRGVVDRALEERGESR